jgi:hypothetical protein
MILGSDSVWVYSSLPSALSLYPLSFSRLLSLPSPSLGKGRKEGRNKPKPNQNPRWEILGGRAEERVEATRNQANSPLSRCLWLLQLALLPALQGSPILGSDSVWTLEAQMGGNR